MSIPLSYNLRNLAVRKTTTVMTALGIALTVAVLCAVLALAEGLQATFATSGNPLNLLLMRKGSNAELSSIVIRPDFNEVIRYWPGIARDAEGKPLASLELVSIVSLDEPGANGIVNLNVRGLTKVGIEVRDETRLVRGRWFDEARREVVVAEAIARKYPLAQIGRKVQFGRGKWEVVGTFESEYPARNSEFWGPLDQMASDLNRFDGCSSVLLRASDPVALRAIAAGTEVEPRLQVFPQTEGDYFAQQTDSGNVIRYLGTFVAIIMAVGSCFAAMNTMYAAVARRAPEIGTLRVLGFSRLSILTSFIIESLLLSLLGGAIGVLLVLPLNGYTTEVGNMQQFSEISFQLRMTPKVVLGGLVFSLIMGALGGFLPAYSAARKQILVALKQI